MSESFVGEPIRTKFGSIYVNPGTGPVEGAILHCAETNIIQLLLDAGLDPEKVKIARLPDIDCDGRFGFLLHWKKLRFCRVEMPGLPLEKVQYLGPEEQNAWDFPRLYVDGTSWLWYIAAKDVKHALEIGGEY